jgi:MoxR-like ATPase
MMKMNKPIKDVAQKDAVDELERELQDLTYEDLAQQAQDLRERINRFRAALGKYFVAKQTLIDLMTICAVAQEPLLLVGPPGTAKSDLVLKFKDALQLTDQDYFEYMLTRFTEPSEVIGPIDINQLREGRYIRRDRGKLPTARLVFLDEIFKSNSAILNSLLTIINERKFYQDGIPEPVSLRILFAATNEIPEQAELAALKDRFCLKAACRSVQEDHFIELIDAGLDAQTQRDLNKKPWAEGHATLLDFLKAPPLPDAADGARRSRRRRQAATRPSALFRRGAFARAAPLDQNAGARRRRLHQRPQGGQALPLVANARVDHARRRGGAAGPAAALLPR